MELCQSLVSLENFFPGLLLPWSQASQTYSFWFQELHSLLAIHGRLPQFSSIQGLIPVQGASLGPCTATSLRDCGVIHNKLPQLTKARFCSRLQSLPLSLCSLQFSLSRLPALEPPNHCTPSLCSYNSSELSLAFMKAVCSSHSHLNLSPTASGG
ncbi:hypothetical protein KIL84_018548 [Mauremys mutica]|uniref:Uncharacterized protein n=1 Tax=Mauremys mutica TaxID=74926 RepID=A0A9D3XQK3_9SAUR|nr:hypothetical protein KIL84_018548 [Mauremys mutica]